MHAWRRAHANRCRGDDRAVAAAALARRDDVVPAALALGARLDFEQANVLRLGDAVEAACPAARDAERRAHAVRDAAPLAVGAVSLVVELDRLRRAALGLPPLEHELDRRCRRASARRRPPRPQAEAVVQAAALRMREDSIGLQRRLEALTGRALGHVGMEPTRQTAEGPLDLL